MAGRRTLITHPKIVAAGVIVILGASLFLVYALTPTTGGFCAGSTKSTSLKQGQSGAGYVRTADSPATGKGATGQADAGSDVIGGNLYVVGGYGCTSSDPLDTVSVYSPKNGSWELGPDYPIRTWGLACSSVGAVLYCFGGEGGGVQAFRLDTRSPIWTKIRNMPSGFADSEGQVSIGDPNDSLVFVMGSSSNSAVASQVWAYDIAHDSYSRKSDMPQAIGWFTAALYGGRIYTFGGIHGNDALVYDIANDSWSKLGSTPGPERFGMIRNPGVASGLIPIVDGRGSDTFYNLTWFYDVADGSFVRGPDTLLPRDGVAGGIVDGRLYVVGGRDDSSYPEGLTVSEQLDLGAFAA